TGPSARQWQQPSQQSPWGLLRRGAGTLPVQTTQAPAQAHRGSDDRSNSAVQLSSPTQVARIVRTFGRGALAGTPTTGGHWVWDQTRAPAAPAQISGLRSVAGRQLGQPFCELLDAVGVAVQRQVVSPEHRQQRIVETADGGR